MGDISQGSSGGWTNGRTKRPTDRQFKRSSHVIQLTGTIFELNSKSRKQIEKCPPPTDINKTNVLTNFHDDWAKIVTSIVFTRKTAPPRQPSKNVTSKVFTYVHYIHTEKNAPPTGGHVYSPIWTIFELVRYINKTNVLTNFHDDWATIVTSRVFTRKTAPPGSHVIQLTGTIFKLNSHIKETNVLTKFHENWAKNVTSRVFTCLHYIHIEKKAPPTGGHVFSPIWTIFKLVRGINITNVLTNFHDGWATIVTSRVKTAPPTGGHVFQRTGTTFELNQHIIKTNILTNFKLGQDFIGAKLLIKFHEDVTRNVASRVFTSKCLRTDGHTMTKTAISVAEQNILPANVHQDPEVLLRLHALVDSDYKFAWADIGGRDASSVAHLWNECSSSHCVNTFFVTVNNGGGGGGGGGGGDGGGGGGY
ncbi:hypothetical protein DPMN_018490 [Dreissena polymorpha]|uniref:Uncharacterized protein n=1 Tax=Dreissena polymorpha TaxID=45954 RepID=A0A9D4NIV0_DREPO|nr:hypothetical protein DPMN_018490 [Dreissena polymorpha]